MGGRRVPVYYSLRMCHAKSGDNFVELVLCALRVAELKPRLSVKPVPQALLPAEPFRWPSATISIFYVFSPQLRNPLRDRGKEIDLLSHRPGSGGLTILYITWSSEKRRVSHTNLNFSGTALKMPGEQPCQRRG